MEKLLELTGHYNFSLSFDEDQRTIFASTNSSTSILTEDLQTLKEVTGAEKAELYADKHAEENFLISLDLPEKQ